MKTLFLLLFIPLILYAQNDEEWYYYYSHKQGGLITLTANCDTMKIIGIGNSIMLGSPNPFAADSANLFGRITANYFGYNCFKDTGIFGQTTTQIQSRFKWVTDQKPALILLEGGINDRINTIYSATSISNLKKCIDSAVIHNIPLVWISILPCGALGNDTMKVADTINTAINAYAISKGCFLADLRPIIGIERTTGINPTPGNLWNCKNPFQYSDNVHFIKRGNQMIARGIIQILNTKYLIPHDTAIVRQSYPTYPFAYKYNFGSTGLPVQDTAWCYLGVDSVYFNVTKNSNPTVYHFLATSNNATNNYIYTTNLLIDTATFSVGDTFHISPSAKGYKSLVTGTYDCIIANNEIPVDANLKVWFESDTLVVKRSDSTVGTWTDLSPNHNDAIQTQVSNSPTWGLHTGSGNLAGLTWGDSKWFVLTNQLNLGTINELYLVYKTTGKAISLICGATSNDGILINSGTQYQYDAQGSFGATNFNSNTNRFIILHIYRNNTTTVSCDINDTAKADQTMNGANNNFLLRDIGDWADVGSAYSFNGVLCAYIAYDRVNTTGERTQIKNYLNTKFSVHP